MPTVRKWRSRFIDHGLEGLVDEPRPGRPATVSIDQVEQVIIDTLESHLRMRRAGHGRAWRRIRALEIHGLQDLESIRSQTASGGGVKLSNDLLFTEKVFHLVRLYLHPSESVLNVADGTVISSIHRKHRSVEFKKFLVKIDKTVPKHLDVHVICDNYATHKHLTINIWLAKHLRFICTSPRRIRPGSTRSSDSLQRGALGASPAF